MHEFEHPQVAGGHEADKVVSSVVGGNYKSRRPTSLSECAGECRPGIAGTEGTRLRIEAVARFGKTGPIPGGGRPRVHSPHLAAGWDRSTA
jgi:hypothetical protein